MTDVLHAALEKLQSQVAAMSEQVENALAGSLQALLDADIEAAAQVLASEEVIDAMENSLGVACAQVLALHQPMAKDMRFVVSTLAIARELEAIADLAEMIARIVDRHFSDSTGIELSRIRRTSEKVLSLTRQACQCVRSHDTELAVFVCIAAEEIDNDARDLATELVACLRADGRSVELCLALLQAVSYFQRIGDLCTNIAKDVIYAVEGKVTRHGGRVVTAWMRK